MRRLAILSGMALVSCSGGEVLDAGVAVFDAGPARDGGTDAGSADAGNADAGPSDAQAGDAGEERDAGTFDGVLVTVTLDDQPIAGATVQQGGTDMVMVTDQDGRAIVVLDESILNLPTIVASHPDARMRAAELFMPMRELTIPLVRFDRSDNEDYPFGDPGEPDRRPTTAQCAHCHQTINEDWHVSPHRFAASNDRVHDLYAGAAARFDSAAACIAAGGQWLEGIGPGTAAAAMRCYLGDGTLEAVNAACTSPPCEMVATAFGGCADCHAPAINGVLGGRDLLEATDLAYDFGVSCDACHRVESVALTDPPGTAGRLRMLRPSEEASPALGGGGFLPLTFGPSTDSPNPRMGGSPRAHFRDATICAGCHEHETVPLRVGDTIEAARWPSGTFPVQSTYAEWLASPLSPSTPCQECHMPPGAERKNGADLQNLDDAVIGISGGWPRAPGAVREHTWWGPRQPAGRMLELAAAVFIDKAVTGGELTATVRVKNVGAGHAIPTGEPMRTIALTVEARCGATALTAVGGDAVPDFGGALERQLATDDWSRWSRAAVGDTVRVVRRAGYRDYVGPLSFGDGSRTPAERGMFVEEVVGSSQVVAVNAGVVTFDAALPAGDVAYLVRDVPDAALLAGAPGFAFGRILAAADGRRQVPHFVATDVVSDNRLVPQASNTTTHRFVSPCSEPVVTARLLYRAYPHALAGERGWSNVDQLMTEVMR